MATTCGPSGTAFKPSQNPRSPYCTRGRDLPRGSCRARETGDLLPHRLRIRRSRDSGTAFKPRADERPTTDARSAAAGATAPCACRRQRHLRELHRRKLDRRAGPVARRPPDHDHHPSRPARRAPPPRGEEDDRRPRRRGRSRIPRRPLPGDRRRSVQRRRQDPGSRVPQGQNRHQAPAGVGLLTSRSAGPPGRPTGPDRQPRGAARRGKSLNVRCVVVYSEAERDIRQIWVGTNVWWRSWLVAVIPLALWWGR
jgi:hypothetical protein